MSFSLLYIYSQKFCFTNKYITIIIKFAIPCFYFRYPDFTAVSKSIFIYSAISSGPENTISFLSKTCFLETSCSSQDFPLDDKFNILGCSLSNIFAKTDSFVETFSNSCHNDLYSCAWSSGKI